MKRIIFFAKFAVILSCCNIFPAEAFDGRGSSFNIGVEGYYDNYKEPIVDLNEHAAFGSLTAGYQYNNGKYFSAVDLRYAAGSNDYKSPSGVIKNIPQYEGEGRLRFGLVTGNRNTEFILYTGLGYKYFYDHSKNRVTNLGLWGYDRRIRHLYFPIGVTFNRNLEDFAKWSLSSNFEFDKLIIGKVTSQLGYLGGDPDITNTQYNGYGMRGEIMLGRQFDKTLLEFGPFFRYWQMDDSDIHALGYYEPLNKRVNFGAAIRLSF